jgi:hypothetical protein
MFQPQLNQRGSNPATFKSGIAYSTRQSGSHPDQPFFFIIAQIENSLHDSRSTMAHLKQVGKAATAIHHFGCVTQDRGNWFLFPRVYL